MIHLMGKKTPDPQSVELLLPLFEEALFPRSREPVSQEPLRLLLAEIMSNLREFGEFEPEVVVHDIVESIDTVREHLLLDAEFSLQRDPAANSLQEIILCYPGFRATMAYRIAHVILLLGVPLLPRLLSELIHGKTGIDIHPGAHIAAPFFIDHGTGVVIGETAIVGRSVHLYQGVTLGSLAVHKKDAGFKRHPTIGDNVTIYANSTILGGDTEIGHDSVIGGNTWLTKGVPPYSIVFSEHKTIVRDRETYVQPIDFSI